MKIGPFDNKPSVAPAASERKGAAATKPPVAEASAHVALSPAATALSGA